MPKFANSNYNLLWDSREGRQIMSMLLQEEGFIKPNYTFYLEKFRIDPELTPSNARGEAIFTSKMREANGSQLMDMRAPLGETRPVDKKGVQYYTGRIPDFAAAGFVETAMERRDKQLRYAQLGDDELLLQYATDEVQRMINDANMTMSYLAAKLLSEGQSVYDQGEGIRTPIFRPCIPDKNIMRPNSGIWTNPSAKILDDIAEIEKTLRDNSGYEGELILEVTKEQFRTMFLTNEQVKEWVRYVRTINNVPLPEGISLTEDLVLNALPLHPYALPRIVLVEEKAKDSTNGVVHGWNPNNVVMRPAGYAGYIRRSSILDEELLKEYANNACQFNFTPVLSGLGVICNSVLPNGNFKEWHTDLFVKAVPTLDEFLYHAIIDVVNAG